jgi:hypothetical protein
MRKTELRMEREGFIIFPSFHFPISPFTPFLGFAPSPLRPFTLAVPVPFSRFAHSTFLL